ncbi:ferrous iron transport protein B [Priestia koreensis]|uniref:ferrous iron transport protein B n=1 Tax=Priestia koreensis TaxID=284581 RepID=UPI003CFBE176
MQAALFGNPNTGKTSLFNQLTGSYEYVGNWSGVTIEKKVGTLKSTGQPLVDLPGIYSLNPLTKDEEVATNFLLEESFSYILNIVNASHLERNLHLTIELLEFGKPLIMVLNMVDLAKRQGVELNTDVLETRLQTKVFTAVARKGIGCEEINQYLASYTPKAHSFFLPYDQLIEEHIERAQEIMIDQPSSFSRWLSLQYFSNNESVELYIESRYPELASIRKSAFDQVAEQGTSLADLIHLNRQQFIQQLLQEATLKPVEKKVLPLTEYIDRIATHKVLGIPFFLLVLFLIFKLTFDWLGTPISDQLDAFFAGPLSNWADSLLNAINATDFIRAVVTQGIIAGVGGVLVFVPQIFILFFFISLIEDSGYMARVALVMDRLMESIGLNGKAFIPLIIGFGCNVPGIMAARTVEQPKERLITILLTPLMSCSARLSVYSLFVAAFFKDHQAAIVLSLYVLGIVVAIILAKLFSWVLKNEGSYFVMEMPPYNIPQWKQLFRSTWDKGKGFVRKAGTFIFGGSVFIWLLSYLGPHGANVPIDESFMAIVSGVFAPIFSPLGFGTWQAASALITGFLAKEVVVSTMNILYFVPDGKSLQTLLPHFFTPLSAYSFLVFILLYTPCLATVAVIQKETGSKKWTAFSIVYALIVAYILSLAVYQIGRLVGLGG